MAEEYVSDSDYISTERYNFHSIDENGVLREKVPSYSERWEYLYQHRSLIHVHFKPKNTSFPRNDEPFTIGRTINVTVDDDLPKPW